FQKRQELCRRHHEEGCRVAQARRHYRPGRPLQRQEDPRHRHREGGQRRAAHRDRRCQTDHAGGEEMRPLSLTACLALTVALAGCSRTPAPEEGKGEVRVAAAADLKFALDELLVAFRESHPEIEVRVTYGASGNFFAQLKNKAPFDLFLSADAEYPRRLIEKGLAKKDDEFLYALAHLVVCVP